MKGWSMRHMEPRDVSRVLELAAAQNRRDGTSYPVPWVFDAQGRLVDNMPLALVSEYRGVVEQADLFERTAELMCFGTNPRATQFSCREMGRAAYLLGLRGYRTVNCLVPKQRVVNVERPLGRAGYTRIDHDLAHFFRSLVE